MKARKADANKTVLAIVVVTLIVSVVVFSSKLSKRASPDSAQQRRILLLYHTDHEALLKAGRQVLSQGPKDLKNYQYYGPMHIDGFPVPRGVRIPKVIRKLRPHASLINFNGYVVLQMQGGRVDFGVRIYPEGFKGYRYYFTSGNRELLPGLEYYDYKYDHIPEYDKIIDGIIQKGKWEEPDTIDPMQSANHQSSR
ncbi:MAG: hypothetical protein ACYTBX_10175 [Planctomycetota bacterium]|jgi:hypothetical protein